MNNIRKDKFILEKIGLAKISFVQKLETKNKDPYLNGKLKLFKSNISQEFKIWENDGLENFLKEFEDNNNSYFKIKYIESSFNNNSYLSIKNFQPMTSEEIDKSFGKELKEKQDKILSRLDNVLVGNVSNKGRDFIKEFWTKNQDIYSKFIKEYAAKGMHDASPVGLLHHTTKMIEVLQLTMKQQSNFNLNQDGIDLIYIGLFLHDIGKIKEYEEGVPTNLAKVTHRALGIEIIVLNRDLILEYYLEDWYYELIAIINQHHGVYEERPHSIFSYLVHLVDMYDTHITALNENIIANKENNTVRVIDRDIPILEKNPVYFDFK